jgi:hypothetical protein
MNPIKQAIELTDKIKNRLQVDIDDGSRPDQWSMEALVDLADRATAALQSMQGEAEPVAYLDEDGRVVRVSVDGSGDGGFVSPNRAIPDYWRPLYTHPQSPAVPDDVLVKAAAYLHQAAEDVAGWGAYASEYFQNKHDLKFDIALYHQRAAELEAILSAQDPKP